MSDQSDGAIDNEFDDSERSYYERVDDALADVRQQPAPGDVVIDLVTRQLMLVREIAAEDCVEYEAREGFDLLTYKQHPWLPGVTIDNTVYECVYLDRNPENAHKSGQTYDFPRGRLMRVPVERAWGKSQVHA